LHLVGGEVLGRKAGVKFLRWPRLPDLLKTHSSFNHLQKATVNDRDRIPDGDVLKVVRGQE
jgi:hypothetical protein